MNGNQDSINFQNFIVVHNIILVDFGTYDIIKKILKSNFKISETLPVKNT